MKIFSQRILSVMFFFFMAGTAAVVSGHVTGSGYQEDLKLPNTSQQQALGIDGATFKVRDAISWTVTSKDGKALGVLLSSESVGKDIDGFGGKTPVFILIDTKNHIRKLAVGDNAETPEYLGMAEEGILPLWKDLDVESALELEVDAVSGATYSSNALIENIMVLLENYSSRK